MILIDRTTPKGRLIVSTDETAKGLVAELFPAFEPESRNNPRLPIALHLETIEPAAEVNGVRFVAVLGERPGCLFSLTDTEIVALLNGDGATIYPDARYQLLVPYAFQGDDGREHKGRTNLPELFYLLGSRSARIAGVDGYLSEISGRVTFAAVPAAMPEPAKDVLTDSGTLVLTPS